jgi:hypothetical protein
MTNTITSNIYAPRRVKLMKRSDYFHAFIIGANDKMEFAGSSTKLAFKGSRVGCRCRIRSPVRSYPTLLVAIATIFTTRSSTGGAKVKVRDLLLARRGIGWVRLYLGPL